ncbi:hypothetical protein [Sulfuricurvum sp.]|uniref:hypothetical protein n=1 Tax=Sulfuricurvum sp. TaxID=2025608 RepID=UPI00261E861F|nr:hypothetical protein [Sulfuricurvum sp.]MDD3595220.1 hypothetical protein [Sulfuricurvum sp.]
MTKEYLAQKIVTIEEALNFANHELKMLLDDEEVEKVRSLIIKRDNFINVLNKIDLMLLTRDDDSENHNELIKLIRSSTDGDDAINNMMKKYSITYIQAETIADMRLNEINDLNDEEKRSMYLDELNSIKKELSENLLYSCLGEKDIEFLIKSLELNISLSEFLSYKSTY